MGCTMFVPTGGNDAADELPRRWRSASASRHLLHGSGLAIRGRNMNKLRPPRRPDIVPGIITGDGKSERVELRLDATNQTATLPMEVGSLAWISNPASTFGSSWAARTVPCGICAPR
jgi:hypothetical protein